MQVEINRIKGTTDVASAPIGIFDSGYGGLTILSEIRRKLPEYDYIYLGDNARAPYGTRSFELVYNFTAEAVRYLFSQGCRLIILACNTASAKALRTIQQHDLLEYSDNRRVLGVIRPTVERLESLSKTGHIGVLGTPGTINSRSYELEVAKLNPDMTVVGQACPMWVPLVENREADSPGADYFVKKYIDALMQTDSQIDTIVLGCTHYPLLLKKIREFTPSEVTILSQGVIVAESLADYLRRHSEIEKVCSKGGACKYTTTENVEKFNELASLFLNTPVDSVHVEL